MRLGLAFGVCLAALFGCTGGEPTGYMTSDGVAVNDHGSQDPYALAMRDENYSLAEQHARRRVREFPEDAHSWLVLTYPLLLTKQFEAAIESCESGIKLDPSHKTLLYARGFIAQDQADSEYDSNPELAASYYRQAIEFYEQALRIDPTFADPYYGLAAANEGLANYHEVIKHAERYLELYPTSPKKNDAMDMIKVANECIGQ